MVPIEDVDALHRASRRSWPHAVVTRRAQGSSGLRLCHSSVTRTMHRSAPHFAPCDPNTPARDPTDFHHGLLAETA